MKLNEIKNELKRNEIEFENDEFYNFEGEMICKGLNLWDDMMIIVSKRGLKDLIENDECLKGDGKEIGLVNLDGSGYKLFDEIDELIKEIKKSF